MEPAVQEHREGPEQDLDAGHLERAPLHLAEAVRGARVQRPHRQGRPGSHTTGEAHVLLLILVNKKKMPLQVGGSLLDLRLWVEQRASKPQTVQPSPRRDFRVHQGGQGLPLRRRTGEPSIVLVKT